MTMFTTKAFLDSVEDLAYEMARDMEDALVEGMVDAEGLAYGDVELGRPDRMMKFVLDHRAGILAALRAQDPEEYRKRVGQFRRDVREAGLV